MPRLKSKAQAALKRELEKQAALVLAAASLPAGALLLPAAEHAAGHVGLAAADGQAGAAAPDAAGAPVGGGAAADAAAGGVSVAALAPVPAAPAGATDGTANLLAAAAASEAANANASDAAGGDDAQDAGGGAGDDESEAEGADEGNDAAAASALSGDDGGAAGAHSAGTRAISEAVASATTRTQEAVTNARRRRRPQPQLVELAAGGKATVDNQHRNAARDGRNLDAAVEHLSRIARGVREYAESAPAPAVAFAKILVDVTCRVLVPTMDVDARSRYTARLLTAVGVPGVVGTSKRSAQRHLASASGGVMPLAMPRKRRRQPWGHAALVEAACSFIMDNRWTLAQLRAMHEYAIDPADVPPLSDDTFVPHVTIDDFRVYLAITCGSIIASMRDGTITSLDSGAGYPGGPVLAAGIGSAGAQPSSSATAASSTTSSSSAATNSDGSAGSDDPDSTVAVLAAGVLRGATSSNIRQAADRAARKVQRVEDAADVRPPLAPAASSRPSRAGGGSAAASAVRTAASGAGQSSAAGAGPRRSGSQQYDFRQRRPAARAGERAATDATVDELENDASDGSDYEDEGSSGDDDDDSSTGEGLSELVDETVGAGTQVGSDRWELRDGPDGSDNPYTRTVKESVNDTLGTIGRAAIRDASAGRTYNVSATAVNALGQVALPVSDTGSAAPLAKRRRPNDDASSSRSAAAASAGVLASAVTSSSALDVCGVLNSVPVGAGISGDSGATGPSEAVAAAVAAVPEREEPREDDFLSATGFFHADAAAGDRRLPSARRGRGLQKRAARAGASPLFASSMLVDIDLTGAYNYSGGSSSSAADPLAAALAAAAAAAEGDLLREQPGATAGAFGGTGGGAGMGQDAQNRRPSGRVRNKVSVGEAGAGASAAGAAAHAESAGDAAYALDMGGEDADNVGASGASGSRAATSSKSGLEAPRSIGIGTTNEANASRLLSRDDSGHLHARTLLSGEMFVSRYGARQILAEAHLRYGKPCSKPGADDHDRGEVQLDRAAYARTIAGLQHRIIKPTAANLEPCIALLKDALKGAAFDEEQQRVLGVRLGVGDDGVQERPILVLSQDEKLFRSQPPLKAVWHAQDGRKCMSIDKKAVGLHGKGPGPSIMVSAFVSPLGLTTFEATLTGAKEGFWDSTRMARNLEETLNVVDTTYPAVEALIIMDHSSCHTVAAVDALVTQRINLTKVPKRAKPLTLRPSYVPDDPSQRHLDTWDGRQPAPGCTRHNHYRVQSDGVRQPYSLLDFVKARETPAKFAEMSKKTRQQVEEFVSSYGDFRADGRQTLFQQVAQARGHRVVYSPKFHCELQPIELMWALCERSLYKAGRHGSLRDMMPGLVQLLSEGLTPRIVSPLFCRVSRYLQLYSLGPVGTAVPLGMDSSVVHTLMRLLTGRGGRGGPKERHASVSPLELDAAAAEAGTAAAAAAPAAAPAGRGAGASAAAPAAATAAASAPAPGSGGAGAGIGAPVAVSGVFPANLTSAEAEGLGWKLQRLVTVAMAPERAAVEAGRLANSVADRNGLQALLQEQWLVPQSRSALEILYAVPQDGITLDFAQRFTCITWYSTDTGYEPSAPPSAVAAAPPQAVAAVSAPAAAPAATGSAAASSASVTVAATGELQVEAADGAKGLAAALAVAVFNDSISGDA
jgi:hypothetical protein